MVQGNSMHTRTGAEDGRKTDGAEYERVVLISTNSILISQDTMCIHIHVLFHVTDVGLSYPLHEGCPPFNVCAGREQEHSTTVFDLMSFLTVVVEHST